MQHLALLESSGLVVSAKAGRVRTCRIEPDALGRAERWLGARRAEWEGRLDRLGDYLTHLQRTETPMAQALGGDANTLTFSRVFQAPRALVFRA